MSTKFELPFDTCFACFQKSDDNCSCKSRKMYEQGKADGAREFAEWLSNTEYVSNHDSFLLPLRGYFTIDEVLAEWQKGEEE